VSQITSDMFRFSYSQPGPFFKRNTTGATCGAGTAYPSGGPEFTLGFKWSSFSSIFSGISWRSVLLVEETGVPGENQRPISSH
jgi:hypothetical protein